jgi:hypothetical protein
VCKELCRSPYTQRTFTSGRQAAPIVGRIAKIHSVIDNTNSKTMTTEPKVKGPASYFPSIEKTYEKPMSYWFDIVKEAGPLQHMELVRILKTEHQMGHGHANAIVAYVLAR